MSSAARASPSATDPSIDILRTVPDVRAYRQDLISRSKTIGLVPTMGALHTGHLSLARRAATENDSVVISIYVNPTQFGVNEDLDAYPRTWDSDLAQLRKLNKELIKTKQRGQITAVFAPTTKTIYPTLPPTSELDGEGSFVTITPLGKLLEGASRPVFFRGVATVCMKLFNIVQPTRVYFGQKDVQQTVVIKRMVRDFHVDTEVCIVNTERESDGLAMSSRNVYLGARRRAAAVLLPKILEIAQAQYMQKSKRTREEILRPAEAFTLMEIAAQLQLPAEKQSIMELEYISLADPDTMEEVDVVDEEKGAILSAALRMLPLEKTVDGEDTGENDGGKRTVRLIDNIILPPIRR
jgi:pantoate--beta-alanine ligase